MKYGSPRTRHQAAAHVLLASARNKQAIESLALRIESLVKALCAPVSEGDTREELRRKRLEQYACAL